MGKTLEGKGSPKSEDYLLTISSPHNTTWLPSIFRQIYHAYYATPLRSQYSISLRTAILLGVLGFAPFGAPASWPKHRLMHQLVLGPGFFSPPSSFETLLMIS
ncbi:hypothetical protein DVH24_016732 [Malus domestica]|uniref:Uncharacterized protein n=1 Tax=Malus domestica TaxID=3750 RepID=A0A498HT36_MALDO|nr:hypothetical protein DVH24_016732 [Malus domestica]